VTSLVDRFIARYGRLPTEVDPDYLEMLRMSKYRIKDVPEFQPGKCANCGASKNDGRKYIDFGLLVDWYGTVYLCGHCLNDVSQAMGLFDKLQIKVSEAKTNTNAIKDLQIREAELHERVVSLVKELEEYYDRLHSIGLDSVPDTNPNLVVSEAATKQGIDSTKSRTVKSAPSGGSKNIRSLADLLEPTE
jgi:hypothetical protein